METCCWLVCAHNDAGIIFNTRDVGVCLAEVKGASAMMRVLFNTRVMEEGCPL